MTVDIPPVLDQSPRVISIEDLLPSQYHLRQSVPKYSSILTDDNLVIDYGSSQCRVGWSSSLSQCIAGSGSYPCMLFDNQLLKYTASGKYTLGNNNSSVMYSLGPGNYGMIGAKTTAKSAYDSYLPCFPDTIETQLEGILYSLEVAGSLKSHGLVMTEPLLQPHALRQSLLEISLEGFQFCKTSFCNDALSGYYYNLMRGRFLTNSLVSQSNDAIIIPSDGYDDSDIFSNKCTILSLGHLSSTLIPLERNGKVDRTGLSRLSIGGHQQANYLLKLMQLKYPYFPVKMTYGESAGVLRNVAYVSQHFAQCLNSLNTTEGIERATIGLQYPYPGNGNNQSNKESADERNLQQQADVEQRKLLFKQKMQQVADRKQQERLAELESQVRELRAMKSKKRKVKESKKNNKKDHSDKGNGSLDDVSDAQLGELTESESEYLSDAGSLSESAFLVFLKSLGYTDEADFEALLAETESKLTRLQNKMAGKEDIPEPANVYDFSILDIPDTDLTPDRLIEKKKLRLIKAGMDARQKIKREKELVLEAERKEAEQDARFREANFTAWLQEKYEKRTRLLSRIKDLARRRVQLRDRKSAESVKRLKLLSHLQGSGEAGDEEDDQEEYEYLQSQPLDDSILPEDQVDAVLGTPGMAVSFTPSAKKKPRKKRKKTVENDSNLINGQVFAVSPVETSVFGDSASSWDLYRDSGNTTSTAIEEQEQEEDLLQESLNNLEELLCQYDPGYVAPAQDEPSIYDVFLTGRRYINSPSTTSTSQSSSSMAAFYQLQINVERIKVPEILFQPSIVGNESIGISEMVTNAFNRIYDVSDNIRESTNLSYSLFLTGGNSLLHGIQTRLHRDLIPLLPSHSSLNINKASNPVVDAWRGAALWAAVSSQAIRTTDTYPWFSREAYAEHGYDRLVRLVKNHLFIQ